MLTQHHLWFTRPRNVPKLLAFWSRNKVRQIYDWIRGSSTRFILPLLDSKNMHPISWIMATVCACCALFWLYHYGDVIMSAMASQTTSLSILYSTVYSDADQRKHQTSVSLAFVRGTHRWPVKSPHEGPVTWIKFPFDDVIMCGPI